MTSLLRFTIAILILTSLVAQADSGPCPLSPQSLVLDYSFYSDINCDFIRNVESILADAGAIVDKPVKVTLDIGLQGASAGFDMGQTIEIFQQFVEYGEYEQSYGHPLIDNLAAIAHEYGHALFTQKIYDRLPEFRPGIDFMRKNSQERFALLKVLNTLADQKLPTKEVEDQMKTLNANRDKFLSTSTYLKLLRAEAAYQELYADAVAVYAMGEKSAISNALYHPQMRPQESNNVEARNFDLPDTFTADESNRTDEHVFFYKVRRFIGAKLWTQKTEQKKTYLRKIGDALIDDLVETLKDASQPDLDSRNDSVIAKIKSKL